MRNQEEGAHGLVQKVFNSLWCKMLPSLYDAFEADDNRYTKWVKASTSTPIYYYPYKYKAGRVVGGTPKEYDMMFRLGEQYLIRAEARAQINTAQSLSGAKTDIDEIRNRAGLGAYTGALNKDNLLSAIEHERQVELFCEWGHRWFDLKRTKRASAVLSPIKADWQDTDMLYPIPESAMRTNKNLTPNP